MNNGVSQSTTKLWCEFILKNDCFFSCLKDSNNSRTKCDLHVINNLEMKRSSRKQFYDSLYSCH